MISVRVATGLLAVCLALLGFQPAAYAAKARPVSPNHDGSAMNPLWSPDGSKLAYEVVHAQQKYTDLFVLDLERGSEERIQPAPGAGALGGRFLDRKQVNHEFTWAPRGRLYAFASSGSDDDFDLYLRGVTVPIGSEMKEGGPAIAADGRRLAFCSARTNEGDLYLADIYALEEEPVRLTFGEGLEFYPAWSPTGNSLAYAAMTETGANIRVIEDVERPKESNKALTQWKANQIKPSWSPDGRWIAFFTNHDTGNAKRFDAYIVPAAGGSPFRAVQNVVPNERRGPAWTPDGKGIIAVRNAPNEGDPLVHVDLMSMQETLIPTGTANNGEPTVAQGRGGEAFQIAFVCQGERSSADQGFRRVWVLDWTAPAQP